MPKLNRVRIFQGTNTKTGASCTLCISHRIIKKKKTYKSLGLTWFWLIFIFFMQSSTFPYSITQLENCYLVIRRPMHGERFWQECKPVKLRRSGVQISIILQIYSSHWRSFELYHESPIQVRWVLWCWELLFEPPKF